MKTITNKFKLAIAAVGLLAIGTANAQTAPGDSGVEAKTARSAAAGQSIKLIDNKGTIKYMQSNNGITTITSTFAGNRTVTTWQLGGTLTDNTYIAAGAGTEFALDGIELLDATDAASTNAVDREVHGNVGTGYTVLLRDEATGAVKKMQLADLLQVNSIRVEYDQAADATADVDVTVAGLPAITAANSGKLFVYRNGVKLRWGLAADNKDFHGDTAGTITINYDATDLPMYQDDVIEVQYIR